MRRIVLLMSLVCLGLLPVHAQDTDELNEVLKQTVQFFITETYNRGNVAPISEYFSPEYVRRPGEAGLTNFIGSVIALRAALPDLQATIDLIIGDGEQVAVRFNIVGTFQNELVFPNAQPIPPTGQTLTLVVNTIYRFDANGQVIEEWNGFDNLSFLAQIGAIPPPENLQDIRMGAAEKFASAPDVNNSVVAQYFTAYNASNLANIESRFADDFAANNPFGILDYDGFVNDITLLRQALPDLTLTPITTVAEDNWVAAIYTLDGTFTVDYPTPNTPLPATNGALTLPVITFFDFNPQGQIREVWELYDGWDFLTQLGLTLPEAPNPVTGEDE